MDQSEVITGGAPAPAGVSHYIDTAGMPVAVEAHSLKFTGTGGEYFRVWIVNVLLTIVTIALYTPVARWRAAKYFHAHTLVARSPLEFTGRLGRMVLGFLMLVGLYLAFNVAAETGQELATALFMLAGLGLAPWLWGSAMRFRVHSTRWRGLRPRLVARWGEIYLAAWPVLAIVLGWAAVGFAAVLVPQVPLPNGKTAPDFLRYWPLLAGVFLFAMLGTMLCMVRLEFNYKRLLVTRARIGGHAGVWKPAFGSFVRIWLASLGLLLLGALVGIAIATGIFFAIVPFGSIRSGTRNLAPLVALLPIVLIVVLFMASSPARAYREARVFQLMWNNVGLGRIARFKCNLRVGRFVWLRIRNVLLTLLTIGFWRPFAKISETRMKTDSVTLHVKGGLDQLVGQLAQEEQQGFGDAIADAVGLDLIG